MHNPTPPALQFPDINKSLSEATFGFRNYGSGISVSTDTTLQSTVFSRRVDLSGIAYTDTSIFLGPYKVTFQGTDTYVGRSTTDTGARRLQHKDFDASNINIVDPTDTTKKLNFTVSGNTAGVAGSIAAVFTTAKTLTLPDATDTLTGKATTDVLTNKTYDTAGTGNVWKINSTQITDKTGTGKVVLDTSAVLTTPALGTPASGVLTNCTGIASGLTAGNVTTNANLTGPITSVGNATSIASQTGTGTTFVVQTSPSLVTPGIDAATGKTLDLNTVAPTVAAGHVGYGATTATTVGAAGTAAALPAQPTGYLIVNIAGTAMKIPYYNS